MPRCARALEQVARFNAEGARDLLEDCKGHSPAPAGLKFRNCRLAHAGASRDSGLTPALREPQFPEAQADRTHALNVSVAR